MVGTDAQHKESGGGETSKDRMRELYPHVRILDQIKETGHDDLAIFKLGIAGRLLHKGIGSQDPKCRDIGSNGNQPDGGYMHAL
ncbi:hypothetical protein SDC9_161515 [bioreactor metagenome]|uniref:Uncharacterized protein n=1 Tax=bioreactor metagenome TaxID=1076179 RepID=A0A645FLH3_9ZZZZ